MWTDLAGWCGNSHASTSDCDDMSDVARYYIEETGALGEVPASLQNYIDYESYGRDLDLSGTFISTNHGIFEIVY